MTDIRQAVLNYVAQHVEYQNHPTKKGSHWLTPSQRMLLYNEDITIHKDSKYWYVFKKGVLIAKAERRWHRTATNPMERELLPKFKERF